MSEFERSITTQASDSKTFRFRILLTLAILVIEIAHLAWEHFHGGVRGHHLMQRADLPMISNWWGLLILPGLAWYSSGRMHKRAAAASQNDRNEKRIVTSMWIGFVLALVFGATLAISFTHGQDTLSNYLFYALLPIVLVFPIHRSEYILGFVLGMTFWIGAVLPTVFAFIVAAISAAFSFSVGYLRNRFTKA